MVVNVITLYAVAIIGPIMIFLTQFVTKGHTRDMTRLWFISFFSYLVFYWLAETYGYFNDPNGYLYIFALWWPIGAILAFWIADILTRRGTAVPFFRWIVYFLVAAGFSLILDGVAGLLQMYSYSADKIAKVSTTITNPLGGLTIPALMPLLVGVLMIVVFYLVFNVYFVLRKRRIDDTSATLLLAALSIVIGGFIWVVANAVLTFVNTL
jgi:hypothetical protein